MDYRSFRDRLLVGLGVGALVLAAGGGIAFAEEEAAVNSGNLSLTLQNDFTTAYYFRGILQENDDMIWEPSLSLGLKVFSAEEGVLRAATLGIGTWESVHSDHTGSSGGGPNAWYEADIYPSLTLAWAGGVTTGITYYWYTSPNNAFNTTEEVDISLAFDDSPYLDKFALHPSLTLAFETKGTSYSDFLLGTSRGSGKGSVAVLAIAPSYAFSISDDYPVTLAMPVTVGLSMHDYYKDATQNDTFGYATVGLTANIPLAFIPKAYGTWSVTNGLNVFFLGDACESVNNSSLNGDGDAVTPVWTSSLVMTY